MKLLRIGEAGEERPAALVAPGTIVRLDDVMNDLDGEFLASGGVERIRAIVASRQASGDVHPLGSTRIGAPIVRPHQIICVGLNYRDHAAESGLAVPDEPILFTKSPNSICGPDDDIVMPRGGEKLDWEIELGVVIGRRAHNLDSPAEAAAVIAGWTLVHDVSERAFQLERGGQWLKGKSSPTFNPVGPWLVTADEVSDVNSLRMVLDVDGIRRQDGTTADMIFDPFTIVWYISQFMALEPGDLINTGTPAGVGMGFRPPVWLTPGSVVDLEIEGLGHQRQTVVGSR